MARSRKIPNPYDRYRAQAYANVLARSNDHPSDIIAEVRAELFALVTAVDVDGLKYAAATQAAEVEDSLRTSPPPGARLQPPLPGWPDPEERVWKLGNGERVVVRSATADDHLRHMMLAQENADAVEDAMRETRGSYYQLAPYYTAGARTVADAVSMWQDDQANAAPSP